MSEMLEELRVYDEYKNIFSDSKYLIPLYQRAYAWKDTQINQLIEDIRDIDSSSEKYYIGSLIVSRKKNEFEVVDGQQRLTSLFLLLSSLKCSKYIKQDIPNNLIFDCRDNSNYTLERIKEIFFDKRDNYEQDRLEQGIKNGLEVIKDNIQKVDFNKELFLNNLKKVIVYRIQVPEHTDLNRYFEIMNIRGEQLEQSDVLKGRLMGYLKDDSVATDIFSLIWDACSDMTGYAQMHFKKKIREKLFSNKWNKFPPEEWDECYKIINKELNENNDSKKEDNSSEETTIDKIISIDFHPETDDRLTDNDIRVRFESIIDFPYFLIHTLKVYIEINKVKHIDKSSKIIDDLIDDKKLLDTFKKVIDNGCTDLFQIKNNKAKFCKDFIICLLNTRCLFDKYIIKREFSNNDEEGIWSLKELNMSQEEGSNNKKPYYKRTIFSDNKIEIKDSFNYLNTINLMLQSALRVSYTSPKIMHWITNLLIRLTNNKENTASISEFTENVIKKAVITNFFEKNSDSYSMGVETPHIVFNYLDFLLWREAILNNQKNGFEDFIFEFRNSVEHWYPQNPSEGTFPKWEEKKELDSFGNLCLIQRNINSRFSNRSPNAKKTDYQKMIEKGSLKLRIMAQKTVEDGEIPASINWKTKVCKEHEKEMINKLKKACSFLEDED